MTLLLADQDRLLSRPPIEHFSPCVPSLGSFRAAVSDLVNEIGHCTSTDAKCAEHILGKRLEEDDLATVLEATPDGWDATVAKLLFEVRNYEPSPRNATGSARRAGQDLAAGADRRHVVGPHAQLSARTPTSATLASSSTSTSSTRTAS